MEDSAKYLIHADVAADGVVERTDVVGAIFGQTEGLLGDELDIRDLQQSAKLGRLDVEVESEAGRSRGRITIASNLDRVETAILAAALESIERVGPCRSNVEVRRIEDVRAAKRRGIVERAQELLADGFDEGALAGDELVESVRESLRVADVTEFEGLPAGPNVAEGDAVVVVEGRADVLTLLRYGIKNAIGVEGTDVPDAVAALTRDRTTTAFFDGDRGGTLLLRELAQVGDVDFVARPARGQSVEDLSRDAVVDALREKVSVDVALEGDVSDTAEPADASDDGALTDRADAAAPDEADPSMRAESDAGSATATSEEATPEPPREAGHPDAVEAATDGSTQPVPTPDRRSSVEPTGRETPDGTVDDRESSVQVGETDATSATRAPDGATEAGDDAGRDGTGVAGGTGGADSSSRSLVEHAREVLDGTGAARLVGADGAVLATGQAADGVALVSAAESPIHAVVLDDAVTQAVLDVAAQHGVTHVIGRERGQFTKQPAAVRVRTAGDLSFP